MSNALTLSNGPSAGSLVVAPRSFGEVMHFSEVMAKCSFVPRHLRGKPSDCLAVVMQALRWEMDPFSVAQKTFFVNEGAAPGYEAQLINAVILSRAPLNGRPKIEWSGTGNDLTCTVTGIFKGDDAPKIKTCRIATIKVRNSSLWSSDPEQQLAYYTTRAWARLYCPDVIMGVYTPDEVEVIGKMAHSPTVGRLDALEAQIIEDAPQDQTKGDLTITYPDDRGSLFCVKISDWCKQMRDLLDASLDRHLAWGLNQTEFTRLYQSVKDRRSREALEGVQQRYKELCEAENVTS